MKIVDDKGKIFGIINLFDLLVLIILVMGLVFVASRINFNQSEEVIDHPQIEVTFLLEEVRFETVESVVVGDRLYEFDTNLVFGEIIDFSYEPHVVYVPTEFGEMVKVENPDRYDVFIKLKSEAVEGPFNVSIATKRVAVGRNLVLVGRYTAFEGLVVRMVDMDD